MYFNSASFYLHSQFVAAPEVNLDLLLSPANLQIEHHIELPVR